MPPSFSGVTTGEASHMQHHDAAYTLLTTRPHSSPLRSAPLGNFVCCSAPDGPGQCHRTRPSSPSPDCTTQGSFARSSPPPHTTASSLQRHTRKTSHARSRLRGAGRLRHLVSPPRSHVAVSHSRLSSVLLSDTPALITPANCT